MPSRNPFKYTIQRIIGHVSLPLLFCSMLWSQTVTKPTIINLNSNTATSNPMDNSRMSSLRIQVRMDNIRAVAPPLLRVTVTSPRTGFHQESYTDDTGEARFPGVPFGNYILHLYGDIEDGGSEIEFTINPGDYMHMEMVKVKYKAPDPSNAAPGGKPISAAELAITDAARAEQQKGQEAYKKKNDEEAKKHYLAAIVLAPKYAAAMNNLGVISMHQKNLAEARHWFEQAIAADPAFSTAYFNLGRIEYRAEHFEVVEKLMLKYTALETQDMLALLMLAESQMFNGHLDEALSNAHKIHTREHKNVPDVHIVAARTLERKNMPNEAMVEYKQYLREAPNGENAENVRQTLLIIESHNRIPPPPHGL